MDTWPMTITDRIWLRFYDTADQVLIGKHYIFRERTEIRTGKKAVTLRFRHTDRYFSQDRDMLAKRPGKGVTKFEEDIKTPFAVLYSFSSTQPVKEDFAPKKMKQVQKLYPGLITEFGAAFDERELVVVNDLHLLEKVIVLGELVLGDALANVR